MMRAENTESCILSEHLQKLVGIINPEQEELENLLKLLWQTRKIGLSAAQKSSLQALLNLPCPGDLGPVLASLRSLIRNCTKKNLEGDDILKLLPPDLPLELQRTLLTSLQKHQNQWNIELSQEQRVLRQNEFSNHRNAGISAPLSSDPLSESSRSTLLQHVDPVPQFNCHNLGGPRAFTAERNVSGFPHLNVQNDVVPHEFMGVLPRLKSMTWTVDNKSVTPANRVAIITLKLQDYTKSPSNEIEVKFQITKDILEAVLRSMAYINQKLSRAVGSTSAPLQKKQRQ